MNFETCPICGNKNLMSESEPTLSYLCEDCGYYTNEKLSFNSEEVKLMINNFPESIVNLQKLEGDYHWFPSTIITKKHILMPIENVETDSFWQLLELNEEGEVTNLIESFKMTEFKNAMNKLNDQYKEEE